MDWIIWIIAGAVIGWLANSLMGTSPRQGLLLDITVGVGGAVIAGVVLTLLVGISTVNQNSSGLSALLVSLVGATILLAAVRILQERRR